MNEYYIDWWLQQLVKVPSVFPPPWDTPTWELGDGRIVRGCFRQRNSQLEMIAAGREAMTIGEFICDISENLQSGDVLRGEEMQVFLKIEGDPKQAPPQADEQIKYFPAHVTSRSVEEQTALKFAGIGEG